MKPHQAKISVCIALTLLVQLAAIAVQQHDLPAHLGPYIEFLRSALVAAGLFFVTPPAPPAPLLPTLKEISH